jgi:hypothetical protein
VEISFVEMEASGCEFESSILRKVKLYLTISTLKK